MTSRTHARRSYVASGADTRMCAHTHPSSKQNIHITMSALSYHRERRAPRALQEGDGASAKESRPFWEFPRGEKALTWYMPYASIARAARSSWFCCSYLPFSRGNHGRFGGASATFSYIQSSSFLTRRVVSRVDTDRDARCVTLFVQQHETRDAFDRPTDRSFVCLYVRPSVRLSSLRRTNINLADYLSSRCHPRRPPLAFPSRTQGSHVTRRAESDSSGPCQRGAHRAGRREKDAGPPVASTRDAAFFSLFSFLFFLFLGEQIWKNSSRFFAII